MKAPILAICQTVLLTTAILSLPQGAMAGPETWFLGSKRAENSLDRVQATLEVGGTSTAVHEEKQVSSELNVVANFQYDERTRALGRRLEDPARSIRHYHQANASIQVGNNVIKPTLGAEHRLVAVATDHEGVTLFCPNDSLTREELDLIDIQANSLLLDHLLPGCSVALKQKWKHSTDLLIAMLRLDAVASANAQSTLVSVTGNIALVEMEGTAQGAIDGVSTEIALKAKYQFDVQRQRITWFGILIQEKRSIGHVQQGLEVVAKLQMSIAPVESSPQLDDTALVGLALEPDAGLTMLQHQSTSGDWTLSHDRRWCITQDEGQRTVLRLVDRGELLAQCNVTDMRTIDPESMLSLEQFQQDIQKGLGDAFGEFTYAGQRANESDYREYRVMVDGMVDTLPIRWIYYLVTDRNGRQVALAFLIEGSLLEQFAECDVDLAANFQFTAPDDTNIEAAGNEPQVLR